MEAGDSEDVGKTRAAHQDPVASGNSRSVTENQGPGHTGAPLIQARGQGLSHMVAQLSEQAGSGSVFEDLEGIASGDPGSALNLQPIHGAWVWRGIAEGQSRLKFRHQPHPGSLGQWQRAGMESCAGQDRMTVL